jgi:hypothetical protein
MEDGPPLQETVIKSIDDDPMWGNRAKAIQAYAHLEQALCRLFALVAETNIEIAAIIFFKITNSQARNDIIQKLFQKQFKDEYNLFRNSLFKNMRPIDTKRNEIVHWNAVRTSTQNANGGLTYELSLKPPTFWTNLIDTPQLLDADFATFHEECRLYSLIISMFVATIRGYAGPMTDAELTTWQKIFLQPLIYPPPPDNPLFQILTKLRTPPPPSQG